MNFSQRLSALSEEYGFRHLEPIIPQLQDPVTTFGH